MKNYSEFHDGVWDGILLDEKHADIFVRTEQKERFVIECLDVVALSVNGVKAGNVIYEVLTRSGNELTVEDILAVSGPFPKSSEESFAQKGLKDAIERGSILLEINPSHGGSGLVLAQSVRLFSRMEWMERSRTTGVESAKEA